MKIPLGKPDIGKDEIQAVIETMKSGWVSQGEKVEELRCLIRAMNLSVATKIGYGGYN